MYYVELNVTQKPESYTHRLPDVTNANDFGKPYTVKYEQHGLNCGVSWVV